MLHHSINQIKYETNTGDQQIEFHRIAKMCSYFILTWKYMEIPIGMCTCECYQFWFSIYSIDARCCLLKAHHITAYIAIERTFKYVDDDNNTNLNYNAHSNRQYTSNQSIPLPTASSVAAVVVCCINSYIVNCSETYLHATCTAKFYIFLSFVHTFVIYLCIGRIICFSRAHKAKRSTA